MYFCDDISGRMAFDKVSGSYHEARPGYPKQVYIDIAERIFNGEPEAQTKNILEVGAGSGQATKDLVGWARYLQCIEPGHFARKGSLT